MSLALEIGLPRTVFSNFPLKFIRNNTDKTVVRTPAVGAIRPGKEGWAVLNGSYPGRGFRKKRISGKDAATAPSK
jgi:hypothetical protein